MEDIRTAEVAEAEATTITARDNARFSTDNASLVDLFNLKESVILGSDWT